MMKIYILTHKIIHNFSLWIFAVNFEAASASGMKPGGHIAFLISAQEECSRVQQAVHKIKLGQYCQSFTKWIRNQSWSEPIIAVH